MPFVFANRPQGTMIGVTKTKIIIAKLEERKIVLSKKIGQAKIYSLNLKDEIAKKQIEIILTLESRNYKRWVEEFIELKDEVYFTILFGSIIRNEKEAQDIDVLIVSDKSCLNKILHLYNCSKP